VQSEGADEQSFYVGGGSLEIRPNLVTVLGRYGGAGARSGRRRGYWPRNSARKMPVRERTDKVDIAEAQAELARAMAQLRAIEACGEKNARSCPTITCSDPPRIFCRAGRTPPGAKRRGAAR